MSVSKIQLEEFAKYIINSNELLQEVQNRVDKRVLRSFKRAKTLAEREKISSMMDANSLLINELTYIIQGSINVGENNKMVGVS